METLWLRFPRPARIRAITGIIPEIIHIIIGVGKFLIQQKLKMFSVFVTNPTLIDRNLFSLWLDGRTIEDAVLFLISKQHINSSSVSSTNALRTRVISQFRNFELLENYLHQPRVLQTQTLFPLQPETCRFLVHSFYSFDERVVRELVGKKLNSRTRKDLSEVVEKTRIPIEACRRMFDNLKRIVKKCEDYDGELVKLIQLEFLLSFEQAG